MKQTCLLIGLGLSTIAAKPLIYDCHEFNSGFMEQAGMPNYIKQGFAYSLGFMPFGTKCVRDDEWGLLLRRPNPTKYTDGAEVGYVMFYYPDRYTFGAYDVIPLARVNVRRHSGYKFSVGYSWVTAEGQYRDTLISNHEYCPTSRSAGCIIASTLFNINVAKLNFR